MDIRKARAALAAVALAAGIAACGPAHTASPGASAKAAPASAAARSDAAQIARTPDFKIAESRAQACVTRGGSMLAVYHCVAPPGHGRARDRCLRAVLARNLTTKAGRAQIPLLAAACAEQNP